jgi:methylmalonic aciduria homocystinuria type C protein
MNVSPETALAKKLLPCGFDLVSAFQVGWYNAKVDLKYRMEDFGRARSLGVIIGNTRALWCPFIEYCRTQNEALAQEHPLDNYTSLCLDKALRECAFVPRTRTYLSSSRPPEVAMQTACHVSGMAALSRTSKLCLHRKYGPWIGLRAVVVLDCEGPDMPTSDGVHSEVQPEMVKDEPEVLRLFQQALSLQQEQPKHQLGEAWRAWLAVREAYSQGREHRYTDSQIEYHYTKNKDVLRRCVAEL